MLKFWLWYFKWLQSCLCAIQGFILVQKSSPLKRKFAIFCPYYIKFLLTQGDLRSCPTRDSLGKLVPCTDRCLKIANKGGGIQRLCLYSNEPPNTCRTYKVYHFKNSFTLTFVLFMFIFATNFTTSLLFGRWLIHNRNWNFPYQEVPALSLLTS